MRLKEQHNPARLLPLLLATTAALLSQVQDQTDGWLNITIIHTNDIHSRVDPANALGTACTAADIAAGNCFGNVTSEIMTEPGYDATTVENHEWDDGPETAKRFWAKLNMPVTASEISSAGPTVPFFNSVEPVQKVMDELTTKGIKRIIAVSHHRYGPDMELAAKTRGLDLIVGGHSHTYLGSLKDSMYQGPYPTLIKNFDEEETLIVQAYCWGRFIGNLDISFNPKGAKSFPTPAAPVLVDHSLPRRPHPSPKSRRLAFRIR
ncbi:hypothetical protein BGX30_004316 [Mortierella sp. GBA39]|nr:hypothetical protein BGX30_004316 [Mortierella sp. GBA39]